LPDTDPIYSGGWKFLAGKNLNPFLPPPADENSEEKESSAPKSKKEGL
jgi:hypothetical protein